MLEDGEIDEEEIEISNEPSLAIAKKSLSPSNGNNTNHNDHDEDDRKPANSNKRKLKENSLKNRSSGGSNGSKKFHKEDFNSFNSTSSNEELNLLDEDRDERVATPHITHSNATSLMRLNTNGSSMCSWSTPMSKNEIKSKPSKAPPSLFDLVLPNPTTLNTAIEMNSYIDPVITEKENNKFNNSNKKHTAKHNNLSEGEPNVDESDMVSVESIEKKMLKKKKYLEINKERQKKEAERQQQMAEKQQQIKQQVMCHFYAEGRCQKGDKCPFSHQLPVASSANRKLEICKYYLNGFCAKNEKCVYMHSEFPCKFFHRINYQTGLKQNQCAYGDQCRFSHEPITDPLVKEAFEKYLSETQTNNSNDPNQQSTQLKKLTSTSLALNKENADMAIPSLMDLPINKTKTNTTTSSDNPSSPPPNNLIKPAQTHHQPPKIPSLLGVNTTSVAARNKMSNNNLNKPVEFKDVDERSETLIIKSNDVDERSLASISTTTTTNSTSTTKPLLTNPILSQEDKYEKVKKELIIKIMKAIADNDGGIFSKIPKQYLTELLVKLLNTSPKSNDSQLSIESIITLLATITAAETTIAQVSKDDDFRNTNSNGHLNGTTNSRLQIDLNTEYKRNSKRDYYDEYDDEEDNCLVIEGNIGEFPYQMIEIDIEPSTLWSHPPVDKSFDSLTNPDQECDPRIKYYSNKSNLLNVANFQLQTLSQNQQQQQQLEKQLLTPTSPNSQLKSDELNGASGAAKQSVAAKTAANKIADPRLARTSTGSNGNNLSPTRSVSPTKQQQEALNSLILPLLNNNNTSNKNDLISIQSRQLAQNSLLSQLADFQTPKDQNNQRVNNQTSLNNILNHQQQQQQQQSSNDSNTVKLSIEDYKRKLQKPNNTNSKSQLNDNISNMNSSPTSAILSNNSNQTNNNSSSLPSIPSYVNLQAPQSLHELLKNFQA